MIDEENHELWTKQNPDEKEILRFPIDQGIISYVALNNLSIRVDDTNIDPRYNKNIDNLQHNYHLKTILAISVKNQEGQAIGVLEAINKINTIFTNEDEEFISLISQQASSALINSFHNENLIKKQYKLNYLIDVILFHSSL